jgi:hypothetical protein
MLEIDYIFPQDFILSIASRMSYENLAGVDMPSSLSSNVNAFADDSFRYESLQTAINEVTESNNFAFFPINWEGSAFKDVKLITSKINDYFVYSSQAEALKQIRSSVDKIEDLDEKAKFELLKFVTDFSFNVSLIYNTSNFEVMVRTEPAFEKENRCVKWHIDKTDQEINDLLSSQPTEVFYLPKQKIILPLFGEPSLFWNASESQHNDFLQSAENKIYFYGFNKSCEINNQFSTRVNHDQVYKTPAKYGSIHLTGIKGAVHSSPEISKQGRILILITIL